MCVTSGSPSAGSLPDDPRKSQAGREITAPRLFQVLLMIQLSVFDSLIRSPYTHRRLHGPGSSISVRASIE